MVKEFWKVWDEPHTLRTENRNRPRTCAEWVRSHSAAHLAGTRAPPFRGLPLFPAGASSGRHRFRSGHQPRMPRRRCRIERATFGLTLEEAASRFDGVATVLPSRTSAVCEPFRCPRSRARPAVHPTTAFPSNRWRSTRPPALRSCVRAAARRGEEVSRRVAVLQTAAPDGCFADRVGMRFVHSMSPTSFSSPLQGATGDR